MEHDGTGALDVETTVRLLERVQRGDADARERLVRRYLAPLQRWARGRLPGFAREITDTDDLVQVALLRALDRVEGFEPRGHGSFLAYLRQILKNQIRDRVRRASRRPSVEQLDEELEETGRSPLERAIGLEQLEAYERALEKLSPEQREAVILRIELGFTHPEVARALGSPSPNAARMLVSRALVRLAEVMDER